MTNGINSTLNIIRNRQPALVLLMIIALLSSQALAQQHIHVDDEIGVACTACLQTSNDSTGLASAEPSRLSVDHQFELPVATLTIRLDTSSVSHYSSRAPPLSR